MEKFALIRFPDGGASIIEHNRLLRKVPRKMAQIYTHIKGPTRVDVIMDRNSGVELGYIYSIPTIYYENSEFLFTYKERQLGLLIKELLKDEIQLLSAPFISEILVDEDREKLRFSGIHTIDSDFFRVAAMYSCFMGLLKILKRQLPYMDIGIWRGDTKIGEIWIHGLAPYFNKMTIGGYDRHRLQKVSDRVLKETGLACEVTTSIDYCIMDRDMLIITEKPNIPIDCEGLLFLSYPIDVKDLDKMVGELVFHSGLLETWCDPFTDTDLNIWEELTLHNLLLYSLSGNYRELVDRGMWQGVGFNQFLSLICSQGLGMRGLIGSNGVVTYDRFRMIYFSDGSRTIKVG